MSKKRSQPIYNPRYNLGAMMLDALKSNTLRNAEIISAPYQQGLVNAVDDSVNDFSTIHTELTQPKVDSELNIVAPGSLDESWLGRGLSSAGQFLFGDYDKFGERLEAASFADAWRLFQEKRLQAELGNEQNQLANVKLSIADLEEAERYASLIDSLSSLRKQIEYASNIGDQQTLQELGKAYNDVSNELKSILKSIKTDGKKRDVFVNLFYDPNKAGITENLRSFGVNVLSESTVANSNWYDAFNPLTYADIISNAVVGGVRGLADVLDNFANLDSRFNREFKTTGNFTRRAIKNSLTGDRWTDTLFEDYTGDILNGGKSVSVLKDKIQKARSYYDRLLAEKEQAVRETTDKYKNGAWYFDPKKINPKFRELSENNDSGLIGGLVDPSQWLYDFSEMGSSYSDIVNMGSMMAIDAALTFGTKLASRYAMKSTPITNALSIIGNYNTLTRTGKIAEAARMAETVQKAKSTIDKWRNGFDYANLAIGAGKIASDAFFVNRMREHETNAEVMDAWTSRVLQNSMTNGADMSKVIDVTNLYLQSIGIDTSRFNELDFVQFALAYNIPTGDAIFEKEKKDGRAGLNKVYNDNMALAAKDYIEMLPFMNYSRSFLRSFGGKQMSLLPEGLANEAELRAARSVFDNAIDKAANKVSSNIGNALQAKHSMDYIKRLAKSRAYTGAMEGVEEGQQSLLQSRYQRGEYDDYDQSRQLFPIEGIWNDTRLAWDAVLSYFGLNFGDPDNGSHELRRAMQIGATTGMFMGAIGAVSNILPIEGADNIRNLIGQLKNDRIINSMVGESYGKAEDDAHIGMFFDALSNRSASVEKLRTSLLDMKLFKGSNVTDDYIDKDIQLLEETYRQYNNPLLNLYLENEKIVKGSDKHKELVQLAVRYNVDKDGAYKKLREIYDELERKKTETLFAIMNRRDELNSSDFRIYEQLVKDYGQFTKKHHADRRTLRQKLELRNPEDFKTAVTAENPRGVMNPAQINQEIDKRLADFDAQYMDFHDFAEKQIDQLYTYRLLTNIDDLIDNYSDEKEFLQLIKKELGIDPNIGKTQSIITALKNIRAAQYTFLDKENYIDNELRKAFNATLMRGDRKKRVQLRKTLNEQLEEKYGLFSDQKDIDDLQKILLLNRAVFDSAAHLANAFNTGKVNPIGLTDLLGKLSWKSLSKEELQLFINTENEARVKMEWKPLTEKTAPMYYRQAQRRKLDSLKKDEENYKKHLKTHTSLDDTLEGDVDGETIMRDAFKHLIDYELNQKRERKAIAHREYLRDSVSPQMLADAAEDGNIDAKTVIDGTQSEESSTTAKTVSADATSGTATDEGTIDNTAASDETPMQGGSAVSDESSEGQQTAIDEGTEPTSSAPDEIVDEGGNLSLEGDEDFKDTGNNLSLDTSGKSQAQLALEEQLGYGGKRRGKNKSIEEAEDRRSRMNDEGEESENESLDQAEERIASPLNDETPEPIDKNKDLDQIDKNGVSDYDDVVDSRDENTVQNKNQVRLNWLGYNFAYQPDATEVMEIKVGNLDVKFRNDGVLRPNGELGQKLLQKGWFEKTDKYFIIFQKNVSQVDMRNPDNLAVGLVLQDGKDVYVVTMKDLSRKISYKGTSLTTGDTAVYRELDTIYDLPENKNPDAYRESLEYGIKMAYLEFNTSVDPTSFTKGEAFDWFNKTASDKEKNKARFYARKRRAGGKGTVPTDEQINAQISQLRATRNQIIDTCCEKDTNGNYILLSEGYKVVRPANPRISRGRFNNVRVDGTPVFQSLLDAPFGLSKDGEQLTNDIRSEKVKIGVGKGKFSYGQEGAIAKLDPDEIGDYNGTGYGRAGKLYLVVEDVHGKEAALMLREQHFEYDNEGNRIQSEDDIVEGFDVAGNLKDGVVPSMAEIALRLVTGRISEKTLRLYGLRGSNLLSSLADLVVNNGTHTFVKDEVKESFNAKKQLWYEEGVLTIAMPNVRGQYFRRQIPVTELYANEALRKKVIFTISLNFHWNTSREDMVNNLNEGVLGPLRDFFDKNKNTDSITLFGNNDLTFKRDDLFDSEMNDKDVSHVAWMIMNGKIMTDIGDSVFYAPFVYADGALTPTEADNKVAKTKAKTEKKVAKAGVADVKAAQEAAVATEAAREARFKSWFENTIASKQEPVAKHAVTPSTKFSHNINAEDQLVYIDVRTGDLEDDFVEDDEIKKNILEGVQRFLDEYNKAHDASYTLKDLQNKISEDDYEILREGRKAVTVRFNDKLKVIFASPLTPDFVQLATVTGVYSESKADGTLDKDGARHWIKQTLGLDDSQTVITNAVLRSLTDKEVFGVTTIAVDRLNSNISGRFILRNDAGRGVYFHEAFHYVNLLLHSPKQRRQIYEAYSKLVGLPRNTKFGVIEEELAEEFRMYCEEREFNRDGFKGWVRKIFDNVIDFVKIWIRRDQVRKLFNDIRRGQYKNATLDQESLTEFKKKYNGIAPQSKGSIPVEGTFNAIDYYGTFYDVAESIANNFIYSAGLNRVSRITNLAPSKFKEFFDNLLLMGLDSNPYIKDVIDNQAAFLDVMMSLLKQYGISAKTKDRRVSDDTNTTAISDNNRTDDEPSGEREQFTWDKYQFQVSAKDNVAFRAKLFLTQVKNKRFVYDVETGERSLQDVQHLLTGLNGFVSFDDAWMKILNNLHDVDGYQELLKEVERLSKTDAFFASLLENLHQIAGDVELENQIFNTVSKHNPQVAQTHIKDHKTRVAEVEDESGTASDEDTGAQSSVGVQKQNDQFRDIEIKNDNTLKAVRMLPRDWSKSFFASPMVRFNGELNVINGDYATAQVAIYKDLVKRMKDGEKLDVNEKLKIYNCVHEQFLQLINNLSIPFDDSTLDVYIDMHLPAFVDRDDILAKYKVLQEIISDTKSGSIGFFVNNVFGKRTNHNKPSIKIATRDGAYEKQLDRIYEGYGKEMLKMASAYNSVHPSSRELSVTGPDGTTIYPISENNYISDVVRWLNKDKDGIIDRIANSPYGANSQLIDVTKDVRRAANKNDLMLKLNVVVGMKDENENKGVDYFGVNTLEDTINKMLFIHNNMIVLPTMADKKTFYTIELISRHGNDTTSYFEMPHDVLTMAYENDQIQALRFSYNTLDIFAGYFLDELNSLQQYYSKENIKQLVKHPERLKQNFHGKVKDGRMDFSGNGGKFRYFYDLFFDVDGLNLNEQLEAAYKRQEFAENPEYGDGVYWIRKDDQELDGFELVRERLDEIAERFSDEDYLHDQINGLLMARVFESMGSYSTPNTDNQLLKTQSTFVFSRDEAGNSIQTPATFTVARAIPSQMLYEYQKIFKDKGYTVNAKSGYRANSAAQDLALSVIGNYVVGQMMSVIEVEKVITGDPAFYKWKNGASRTVEVDGILMSLSQIKEKDTDKIKRLGAVLSPGSELRQDFTEEEYAKYPWLRGTKYTNVHVSDISAKSVYLEQISNLFEKQAVADKFRYGTRYKDKNVSVDDIFRDNDKFEEAKKLLSQEDLDDVKKQVDASTSPYGADKSINVSDAQVLIRPDAYRKIRAQLGQWLFKKTKIKYKGRDGKIHTTYYSDEDAFNILQTNPNWIGDDELYAKVKRLQLFPLKMTYFENTNVEFSEDNNVMMPMYNKMAIFPAFKYLFTSKTGQQIYDRMNKEGEEIDMFTFESAVKVGLNSNRYSPFDKKTTDLSTLKDGLNKSSKELGVVEQDFAGIRMQLNTEAHTDAERAIGTQMFKILFSNLIDTETYKNGKTGKQIRQEIMSCINALTVKGVRNIKKKFFDPTLSVVDRNKVSKWLQNIAENNGATKNAIDAIKTYGIIASLMSSPLYSSSVNAMVNSEVIDINTKGGSAIQLSMFGFSSYSQVTDLVPEWGNEYPVMNNGRTLKWIVDEELGKNSMEVLLSMNFFKSVVPKDKQNNYLQARQWLIDNDIIKGFKSDGTQSKPKPFGVGYRIPTQGMSSTFAFTVADVLPEQSGDLIVVPPEFTSQTGSDFDVDKLFLATMSYKNGELESYEGDDFLNMTEGLIGNKLISSYIDVLTDDKNFSNARGSIDVVTDKILDEVLSIIKKSRKGYAPSMYELTPDFQSRRKAEFSTGKSGIGPFALNITNLALTQFAHLTMDFGENEFEFGDLDAIVGEDGYRISDWLSAMVNAHVDVAKDPYVFDLNVNQATYKFVNFLLRAGKGKATFLFLAQPALKEWASAYNNSGGIYGDNLYLEKEKTAKYGIIDEVIGRYKDKLQEKIKQLPEDKQLVWVKQLGKISSGKLTKSDWANVFGTYDKQTSTGTVKRYYAEDALENPESLRGLQYQLMALKALKKIEPYAQELSDLVKVSRVDTKKFGNTIPLHRNFVNTYNVFKYKQREVDWKCTDGYGGDPLQRYFELTFLDTKLFAATNISRTLLKHADIQATDMFGDLMNTVMGRIFGFEDPIVDKAGKTHTLYKPVSNDDKVKALSTAAESIVKNKMLMYYGLLIYRQIATNPVETYTDYYNYRKVEADNGFSGPIDFTFGGDPDIMRAELYRIMFGDPTAGTPYYKGSIFTNIAKLIADIQTSDPETVSRDYTGLADPGSGRIVNELLNYLRPQPAGLTNKIPRMLLAKNNRNTIVSDKERITQSFDFMLRHNNPLIRKLARDIAVYAYYSTYNTNEVNSFFELVPHYFRQQYDISMKMGLDMQNTSGLVVQAEDSNGVFSPAANIGSLIDLICRNYYNDNDIVPLYQIKYDNSYADKFKGEYQATIRDVKNRNVIPSFFATTRANVPYVKMQVKGVTYLYKLRGAITKENKEGDVQGDPWNVYTLAQKLGLHDGSTHQYELSASAQSNSIYSLNEMPASYDENKVSNQVAKFIELSQRQYKDGKIVYTSIEKSLTIIKEDRNEQYESVDDVLGAVDNTLITDKQMSEIGDVHINLDDFSADTVEAESAAYEKEGVSVSVDQQAEIEVSQKELDEFVQQQGAMWRSRNPQLGEEAYNEFIEQSKELAKDILELKKRVRMLADAMLEIGERGIHINSIYTNNPFMYKHLVDSQYEFIDDVVFVKNNGDEQVDTNPSDVILSSEESAALDNATQETAKLLETIEEIAEEAETAAKPEESSIEEAEVKDESSIEESSPIPVDIINMIKSKKKKYHEFC